MIMFVDVKETHRCLTASPRFTIPDQTQTLTIMGPDGPPHNKDWYTTQYFCTS